jgi:hypothetical protein
METLQKSKGPVFKKWKIRIFEPQIFNPDRLLDFASGNQIYPQTSSPQPSGIGGEYEQVEAVIPTSTQKGFMRVKATVP